MLVSLKIEKEPLCSQTQLSKSCSAPVVQGAGFFPPVAVAWCAFSLQHACSWREGDNWPAISWQKWRLFFFLYRAVCWNPCTAAPICDRGCCLLVQREESHLQGVSCPSLKNPILEVLVFARRTRTASCRNYSLLKIPFHMWLHCHQSMLDKTECLHRTKSGTECFSQSVRSKVQ